MVMSIFWRSGLFIVYNRVYLDITMQDPAKKLSRPTQEAERAAALRDNLKKRKSQTAARKKDKGNDAATQNGTPV